MSQGKEMLETRDIEDVKGCGTRVLWINYCGTRTQLLRFLVVGPKAITHLLLSICLSSWLWMGERYCSLGFLISASISSTLWTKLIEAIICWTIWKYLLDTWCFILEYVHLSVTLFKNKNQIYLFLTLDSLRVFINILIISLLIRWAQQLETTS